MLLWTAALLPACATTAADDEIRKLEARAAYEAGVKSIADGRISLGLSSLRQAVEIEPRNPLYHNAVGAVMLNIGRFADAQGRVPESGGAGSHLCRRLPQPGLGVRRAGEVGGRDHRLPRALAQTIYTRPETTYNNLGYAYWALDRRKDAEDAFRAALQLEPKLVPSHFWLGVLLQKEGRQPEAKVHLRAARDLDPASMLGKRADEVLKALGTDR